MIFDGLIPAIDGVKKPNQVINIPMSDDIIKRLLDLK